jgi:hypothetical protein
MQHGNTAVTCQQAQVDTFAGASQRLTHHAGDFCRACAAEQGAATRKRRKLDAFKTLPEKKTLPDEKTCIKCGKVRLLLKCHAAEWHPVIGFGQYFCMAMRCSAQRAAHADHRSCMQLMSHNWTNIARWHAMLLPPATGMSRRHLVFVGSAAMPGDVFAAGQDCITVLA